jgi:hypothetical protein
MYLNEQDAERSFQMRKTLFFMVISIVLISGCATSGDNPLIDNSSTPNPTMETDKPTEQPEENEPMLHEPDKPTELPEEIKPTQATLVPTSGSVDLGELTPETSSGESGDLNEAPAPGIPDQQVRLIALTREDLSLRLGLDVDEIQLEDIKAVEWKDSSLGCSAPGMMYLQVITPGYEITLSAQGQSYSYHTDQDDSFVLCQQGRSWGPVQEKPHPYP